MTLYAKMAIPDSQRYPWNIYLINIFQGLKVINLYFFATEMRMLLLWELAIENNQFLNNKYLYLIHTWLDTSFSGTIGQLDNVIFAQRVT